MKKFLFFALLVYSLTAASQTFPISRDNQTLITPPKSYTITRYEQTGTNLFICINSTRTPNYMESVFTTTDMDDSVSIKKAIINLVAQLSINDSLYVPPPPPLATIVKLDRAMKYIIDPSAIRIAKRKIRRENDALRLMNDSIQLKRGL